MCWSFLLSFPFGAEGLTEQAIDLRSAFKELDKRKPRIAWPLPEEIWAKGDWRRLPGDRHLYDIFDDDRHPSQRVDDRQGNRSLDKRHWLIEPVACGYDDMKHDDD